MENKNNTEQQLNNINQSVGAPHIRQRLYFVADSISLAVRSERPGSHVQETAKMEGDKRERVWADSSKCGTVGELADAERSRRQLFPTNTGINGAMDEERESQSTVGGYGNTGIVADAKHAERRPEYEVNGQAYGRNGSGRSSDAGILEHAASDGRDARRPESDRWSIASGCGTNILGDAINPRLQGHGGDERDGSEPGRNGADQARPITAAGPTNGFWRDAQWIYCRDDKYRAVEPGTFPLAHGAAARVGRLRGYGNAIVAPVAEAFIRAYLESQLKS